MIEHHKVSTTTQGEGSMGGNLVPKSDTETKSISTISSDDVTGNKAKLVIQGSELEEKFKIVKILDSIVELKFIYPLVCEACILKDNDGCLHTSVCIEEHRIYSNSYLLVLVCKKACPYLEQAPRPWLKRLAESCNIQRYKKGDADKTWSVKKELERFLVVCTHPDNIVLGGMSNQMFQHVVYLIQSGTEMRLVGKVIYFLDVQMENTILSVKASIPGTL
jgi:hypothetical protein